MLDGGLFKHNRFTNITIENNTRHKYECPIFIDIDKREDDSEYRNINHLLFKNLQIVSGGKILISGNREHQIENLMIEDISFYVDNPSDFSKAKKPRGNKKYPALATSTNFSQLANHIVVAYTHNFSAKNVSIINTKRQEDAEIFTEEVTLKKSK